MYDIWAIFNPEADPIVEPLAATAKVEIVLTTSSTDCVKYDGKVREADANCNTKVQTLQITIDNNPRKQ